jgi:hypothetical protein
VVLTGASCTVREGCLEVMTRLRQAIQHGDGWFEATADRKGESVWINARLALVVSRERTPLEAMDMAIGSSTA